MTLQNWWIFVCATFLISAMPGPNMLHVMTQSMRHGFRRAAFTMAGCMLALLMLFGLSAMGMSALLAALPQLLTAIKIVGAAYLVWVGIKAWRDDSPPIDIDAAADLRGGSPADLFRQGFLISVSNPKALIFAAAFFPQFVSAGHDFGTQVVLLSVTFVAVAVLVDGSWALAAARARGLLAGRGRLRNRIAGGMLIGAGAALAAARHR